MSISFSLVSIFLVALSTIAGCDKRTESVPASNGRTQTVVPTPAPDNTASNKGDAATAAKTPMDQSESAADIKTTADIRRAIMDDKVLSVNARNCKIITDKTGLVTLRGVVDSQAEKDSIESKAKGIAGASSVNNLLEVTTK